MAGFTHFLKTILIPLFLAAILYLLLSALILPFVRRHRSRYSQYLPVPANVSDFAPPSWRTKVSDALYSLFVPSSWGRHRAIIDARASVDDDLFDDEEGEAMAGFDPVDERRREALEQRRSMMEEERRLGRELEAGFKDDSEDEEDERRRSLSRHR